MNSLKKISANAVGVIPAYVKGMQKHGFCYFMWETANAVGAQCAKCHAIVWQDPRKNKILNEAKPADVPEYGNKYTVYYQQKIRRFLADQPNCPECGSNEYDRFINNVNFPRYADGTVFTEDQDVALEEHSEAMIWWQE
jgi:hypothetical protein